MPGERRRRCVRLPGAGAHNMPYRPCERPNRPFYPFFGLFRDIFAKLPAAQTVIARPNPPRAALAGSPLNPGAMRPPRRSLALEAIKSLEAPNFGNSSGAPRRSRSPKLALTMIFGRTVPVWTAMCIGRVPETGRRTARFSARRNGLRTHANLAYGTQRLHRRGGRTDPAIRRT